MPRLLVVLLGLLAADARADGYHHVPRLPARATTTTTAVAPPPTGPTVGMETVLSIEPMPGQPRPEQEQILVALIQQTPDSDVEEKSDYYFRLATFYAQQQAAWHAREAQLKGQDRTAAGIKARDYLLKAVKMFKALTDNDAFRTYPKLDTALFSYGYALQTGKYMAEARAVYDKLLKNFPNSAYVPEAHLVFAEYYFAAGQPADAEARYKLVLKFPKSRAYWFAMYKLGWIHLGLQHFQEALETFFQVVQATKHDAKQVALHRAARLDFVRAYAEIGKPDKALAAFQRVDAAGAREMVAALADLYATQGKAEHARALGVPACPAQLGDQARAAHLAGDLPRAEQRYTDYLACFPEAADRAQVQYFLAEVLWAEAEAAPDAAHWARAAEAFTPFLATEPEAARATAFAWRSAIDVDVAIDLAQTAAAAVPVPRPLAARDARIVDALTAAIPRLRDADEVAQTELALAIVLRRADQLDEVARLTADILEHHRQHDRAELAANLLIEAMIGLERYDALLELADRLHADAAFMRNKPELARNLAFVRSRSLRRR